MAPGYLASKTHDAACFETACLAISSSQPSTINDHEPRPFAYNAASADCHSHPAFDPSLGGRLPVRAFASCARLFHSHRRCVTSRTLRRAGARSLSGTGRHSARHVVPASAVQSLPNQQILQTVADRLKRHREPLVNVRFAEKQHAREDFQIAGNFFQKRARKNAC